MFVEPFVSGTFIHVGWLLMDGFFVFFVHKIKLIHYRFAGTLKLLWNRRGESTHAAKLSEFLLHILASDNAE